jgi:hypothetical protein
VFARLQFSVGHGIEAVLTVGQPKGDSVVDSVRPAGVLDAETIPSISIAAIKADDSRRVLAYREIERCIQSAVNCPCLN